MKKLINSIIIILAVAFVTVGLSVGFDKSKISADTAYRYDYNFRGELPCFNNIADSAAYLKQNIASTSNSFYYDGSFASNVGIGDIIDAITDKVFEYDGNATTGDYYRYNYSLIKISYANYSNRVSSGSKCYYVSMVFSFRTTSAQEAELASAIDNALAQMDINTLSTYGKIKAIYTYITSNVTYDDANYNIPSSQVDPMTFTAYKAMNSKTAVCQGIALLFYRMCLTVGIDCRIIRSATHAWNIVELDGCYYNVDATWDLGCTSINEFRYFLLPNCPDFTLGHHVTSDPVYNEVPMATAAYPINQPVAITLYSIQISDYPEVAAFVERLYTKALNRAADTVGLENWVYEIVINRQSGGSVALGFFNSQEFVNRNLSDSEFVEVLYNVFFDRESDPSGKSTWVQALTNGLTREQVVSSFINSSEWATECFTYGIVSGGSGTPNVTPNQGVIDFATRLYNIALGREADPTGLDNWARSLANRQVSGSEAAYGFFFSEEFVNANYSSEEFVSRLYRTFLGREADEQGFNNWVGQLEQGVTRESVFEGFANSAEFENICNGYGINR